MVMEWCPDDDGSVGKTGDLRELLDELESVATDAEPVRHGRWIDVNPDSFWDPRMRCSICKQEEIPLSKWHYCPNCGAKMDKEE